MKKPKFTDEHKFPKGGYKPACNTDITATWERARKQIEKAAEERAEKIKEIRQIGVKARNSQ